jgi:membrane fusion protein (multidrug efflux system)
MMGLNGRRAAGVLIGLSLVLSACGPKKDAAGGPGGAPPPAAVGVMIIKTEPVSLTTDLSGRTSAYEVSEVRPQVGGVIQARLFQEGSIVRAGQPLYQIDPATYRAGQDSALAGLAQAQATLLAAKLKAERYGKLAASGYVSRQDNDDAQAAFQQASANVSAQKAAVQQAKINLQYTRVLAPISGRIGKSTVTPGALVTTGQATPLATIQDLGTIYVDVTQSAADLMKLKRDMASGQLSAPDTAQVTLVLEDGTVYPVKGTLQFADVTVDPGTGSVNLRAVFPNANGALLPGLFVRARLSRGIAGDGILVPQAAITRSEKGEAEVYVVGADNKPALRVLTLGQTVGTGWLVTSGLKAGEQVIVEGLQKVRPGVPVKPQLVAANG